MVFNKGKLPSASGKGPDKLLLLQEMEVKLVHLATMELLSPPVNVTLSRFRVDIYVRFAKLSGMEPVTMLAPRLRLVRFMLPRHEGMDWLKRLSNRRMVCKDLDSQNWSYVPDKWLSATLM